MINKAKMHMSIAYNHLRSLTVSHDNVKLVALAEQELENAFQAIEEAEKAEEADDGQTD